MSQTASGVEKHAQQVKQENGSSGGISSKIPNFSVKTWVVIGIIVAIIVLVAWWRFRSSGDNENNSSTDDTSEPVNFNSNEDESDNENGDVTEITIEEDEEDPLSQDREFWGEFKNDYEVEDVPIKGD